MKAEIEDLQIQIEQGSKKGGMSSEMTKKVEAQINDLTSRLEQSQREMGDMQVHTCLHTYVRAHAHLHTDSHI